MVDLQRRSCPGSTISLPRLTSWIPLPKLPACAAHEQLPRMSCLILVTFASVNDPNTVAEIDPNDLQATLGPGISWNEVTLEITDEPITKGIEQKLPWIPYYYCTMLDGARYHDKKTLANTLSTADFDETGEAGRRIGQKPASDQDLECWKLHIEWQQRSR